MPVVVVAAAVVYASTNVDNFVLLLAYSLDRSYAASELVAGQVLGIGALTALSIAGASAAARLPPPIVGLLGLVPLTLGVGRLLRASVPARERAVRLTAGAQLGRIGSVAATAVAAGGDNLAAYVPFFAGLGARDEAVAVAAFGILTLLWCGAARLVAGHPTVEQAAKRHGDALVGIRLVALGGAILIRGGTLAALLAA